MLGFILITLHQSDYFRAVPGDLADARFNNLILEHLYRWARGTDASLWSPGFFYPYQETLAFSDNHLGTGAVYVLLRFAGLSPETAYDGWYSFAAPLNYLCCYVAFRKMRLTAGGSAVGAFIFTFAMCVSAQVAHGQLAYRFAIPLAMLAWHRLVENARVQDLVLLVFWVTVQFYCSIYLGYFLLLLLATYLAVELFLGTREGALKPHRALITCVTDAIGQRNVAAALSIAACVVALAALFYPYLHVSHLYGFTRDYAETRSMLPRPKSYLLADGSLLWNRLSAHVGNIPMRWEQQMFFGASAILLSITGLIFASDRRGRFAFASLALLIVLTLCVGRHERSIYALIYHLPLANAIRAVARICLVMIYPIALMAAIGFDFLIKPAGKRPFKIVCATALTILMVAECGSYSTVSVPLTELSTRLASLAAGVPKQLPSDAILYVPPPPGERPFLNELDGMLLGQRYDRNTVNGYSGNWPVGYSQFDSDFCDVVNNRLSGYAAFAALDYDAYKALVDRVIVVGNDIKCDAWPSLSGRTHFRGKLSNELARSITLDITDVSVKNEKLLVKLRVFNRSAELLPSVSDDYRPVRFSWRFVPAGSSPGANDGWVPRKDMMADVPAGKSQDFRLLIDPPKEQGQYRLEANMVQETLLWFNQAGMDIGRASYLIDVGNDDKLTVSH
jgi:hypothetical protein